MERYLYASPEPKELSGKITAALVPVEMAVLRAISRAPMTWLKACLRPPLPVRPLRAGTATAARSPIMPTTARSSTRVKAAAGRLGVKGLRDEGVKGATEGFWILNFDLCRGEKVRMCKSRGCGTRPDAGCDGCFEENVVGVADLA